MSYVQNKPKKIIVHHTADGSLQSQFQKVNDYHKQKWEAISDLGYYVGYHYFIEKSGSVIQARKEDEMGVHCYGENDASIGIALAGNFDYQLPTANQIVSLCKLIDYLVKKWQIPANNIFPHRKFKPTSCYGLKLSDEWAGEQYRHYLLETLIHLIILLKAYGEKAIQFIKS